MMMSLRRIALGLLVVAALLCAVEAQAAAPVYGYKIVAKYPHSTESYTEGLFYLNGLLYEGTGLKGRSALLVMDLKTGKVLQQRALPAQYFGEGIVDWGPDIFEWTWESHVGFVLDRFSLRLVRQFTYTGQGWGMTRTAREIVTSDGTSTLRFRDPKTFRELRHVVVRDGGKPIENLNELEYIKGELWANVWHSDLIARLSPADGHVISWVDLSGILPESEKIDGESVLNGIAYDAQQDRIFVTGKQWPTLFEIQVVKK